MKNILIILLVIGIYSLGHSQEPGLNAFGPIEGSLYRMGDIKILPAGSGFKGIRYENSEEILASLSPSLGLNPPSWNVDQVKIGDVKILNHLSDPDELWIRYANGATDVQLMRLGPVTSAINTDNLYLGASVQILHGTSSNGSSGLGLFNIGGNGNYWDLYVANGNGNLEFWYKGAILGRIRSSDGVYATNSDIRLKSEIENLPGTLDKLLNLQPKKYRFKNNQDQEKSIGFIAQEVQALFPELVYEADQDNGYLSLNYSGFSVLAIQAIKEQQEMIVGLQTQIDELKSLLTKTLSNQK